MHSVPCLLSFLHRQCLYWFSLLLLALVIFRVAASPVRWHLPVEVVDTYFCRDMSLEELAFSKHILSKETGLSQTDGTDQNVDSGCCLNAVDRGDLELCYCFSAVYSSDLQMCSVLMTVMTLSCVTVSVLLTVVTWWCVLVLLIVVTWRFVSVLLIVVTWRCVSVLLIVVTWRCVSVLLIVVTWRCVSVLLTVVTWPCVIVSVFVDSTDLMNVDISVLMTVMTLVLFGTLFELQLSKNFLMFDDYHIGWRSEGHTYLDFSFFLVIGAAAAFVINFILLYLSGQSLSCSYAGSGEKEVDNGMILYWKCKATEWAVERGWGRGWCTGGLDDFAVMKFCLGLSSVLCDDWFDLFVWWLIWFVCLNCVNMWVCVCVSLFCEMENKSTRIHFRILHGKKVVFLYLTQLVLVILNSLVLFSFAVCILIVKLMYM